MKINKHRESDDLMEKKTLNTTSYDDIISSIAYICNCNIDSIYKYLENTDNFEGIFPKDVKIETFFKGIGVNFKRKSELYEKIKFDELVISHLTSRINNNIANHDIYNLIEVLSNSTELSNFLSDRGLEFKKTSERLVVFYKNDIIDWDKFESSIKSRVKSRLNKKDSCVNGFLLNDNFWKDVNVEHIKYYPEIVSDICYLLKRNDILEEWKLKSKTYAVRFLADIDNVIFDCDSNLKSTEAKVYLTYKYIIYYLIQRYHNKWNPRWDNAILRLPNNYIVSKSSILGFYEIEV